MKKLTRENLAEAKRNLQETNNPSYGGYNLLYNDNYYYAALQAKWGDMEKLAKDVAAMEAEIAAETVSTKGAGI